MENLVPLQEFLSDYIVATVTDPDPFSSPYPKMAVASGKIDLKQLLTKAKSGGVKALIEPLKQLLSKVKGTTAKKIARGLKMQIGKAFNLARSRNMSALRKFMKKLWTRVKEAWARIRRSSRRGRKPRTLLS